MDHGIFKWKGWSLPAYLGMSGRSASSPKSAAHIVIDLETFSLSKNAAIVAIGAAALDHNLKPCGWFYTTANLQSSLQVGMEVDGNTTAWWMQQPPEVQQYLALTDGPDIGDALSDFAKWASAISISSSTRGTQYWGCGPEFDIVVLENAMKKAAPADVAFAFPYRNIQSIRTLRYIDIFLMTDYTATDEEREMFPGPSHVAVYDAIYEADTLTRVMGWITNPARRR